MDWKVGLKVFGGENAPYLWVKGPEESARAVLWTNAVQSTGVDSVPVEKGYRKNARTVKKANETNQAMDIIKQHLSHNKHKPLQEKQIHNEI